MEKKSDRISEFVDSFEKNELTDEQQAILLGGGVTGPSAPHGNNCRCHGDNCDCYT